MSKWDFIRNITNKVKRNTKNIDDGNFHVKKQNPGGKWEDLDIEVAEPNRQAMYKIPSENSTTIDYDSIALDPALLGAIIGGSASIGYGLGKPGEEEKSRINIENIDELVPELLKILKENGYINNPNEENTIPVE